MRKTFEILIVALIGGAIALALDLGEPQALAQENSARWDYKVLRLDPRDYKDKLDWKAAERQGGRDGAEAVFYEHVLDTLARDGWELVQTQQRAPLTTYFYLRKRL